MLCQVGQSLGDCRGVNTWKRKNFSNDIQKPKKAYFLTNKYRRKRKKTILFLIIFFTKWEYQPKECFGPSAYSKENSLETFVLERKLTFIQK